MKCEPKNLWIYCVRRFQYLKNVNIDSEAVLEVEWQKLFGSLSRDKQEAVAELAMRSVEREQANQTR
jgi:hypothetical protein